MCAAPRPTRSLLAAVALLAAAHAAHAGPAAAARCPVLVDPRGDATPVVPGAPPDVADAAPADLLSADAWTENGLLTVTIRVARLPGTEPRAHGHWWQVSLQAEEGRITVYATESNGRYQANTVFERPVSHGGAEASAPANLGGTVVVADRLSAAVRLSVPLSVIAAHARVTRGTVWVPTARSYRLMGVPGQPLPTGYFGPSGVGEQADDAEAGGTVTVGRPDCARPPRR